MEKRTWRRMKIMIILSMVMGGIFLVHKLNIFQGYSLIDMKEYFNSFGLLAPVVYILLFTLSTLTLFPDSMLVMAAGMTFGLLKGFLYSMIGAVCGATLSYFLSKVLGEHFIRKIIKRDTFWIINKIQERAFVIILILRLIPLFPFDVVSYSAGLAHVKYKDFIGATLLGIVPGVLVYANLGDKSIYMGTGEFYTAITLLALLLMGSLFLKKKLTDKTRKKEVGDRL